MILLERDATKSIACREVHFFWCCLDGGSWGVSFFVSFPCEVVPFPLQSLDCSEICLVFSLVTSVRLWDKHYVACPQRSSSGRKSKSQPVQFARRPIAGAVRDTKAHGRPNYRLRAGEILAGLPWGCQDTPLPQPHGSLGEGSWSISPEIFGAYPGPTPGHLCHSCTGLCYVHVPATGQTGIWEGDIGQAAYLRPPGRKM